MHAWTSTPISRAPAITGPRTPTLDTLNGDRPRARPDDPVREPRRAPRPADRARARGRVREARPRSPRRLLLRAEHAAARGAERARLSRPPALGARVRWQRPRDYTPARTHLFVRVELDEPLARRRRRRRDVTDLRAPPRRPRRTGDAARAAPARPRRPHDLHQARLGDDWHDVCEFTLEEMPLIDRDRRQLVHEHASRSRTSSIACSSRARRRPGA